MKRSALLAPVLALALLPTSSALAASANQTAVDNATAYLDTQQGTDGQISGYSASINYWAAFAYAAAGTDPATVKKSGGTSLLDYLKNNPPAAGSPATDYERDILAITATGNNPYDFGGVNYVSALEALHSSSQIGSTTAVNDDFFGIAALISARVPNTDAALTDALSFTLAHQHADGGFSYTTDSGTGSDVDDTAATLMALEAAKQAGLTVSSTAVTNAENYMLGAKNTDGGFPYDPTTPPAWGGPVSNVSSTSWVVMALAALGQGNSTASTDAQAFIRSQQQSDGSFPYNTASMPGDTFDTAYAVIALTGSFWPLNIYEGPLPSDNNGSVLGTGTGSTPSPSANPSPTPSASPSASPSPSQRPAVLGDSTSTKSGSGSVLGAATGSLPVTGNQANLILLALAFILSLAAGTWTYLRSARRGRS